MCAYFTHLRWFTELVGKKKPPGSGGWVAVFLMESEAGLLFEILDVNLTVLLYLLCSGFRGGVGDGYSPTLLCAAIG